MRTLGGFFDNNYFEAYRSKGGSILALISANIFVMILHNLTLILIYFAIVEGFGYGVYTTIYFGVAWAFMDPFFVCTIFMVVFNTTRQNSGAVTAGILYSLGTFLSAIIIPFPTLLSSYYINFTL